MASITKSPGTMADDATVGIVAWSNPDNAKVSDNVYAMASLSDQQSHYLKATNFGFSIPAGATIDGILVEVEVQSTHGYMVTDVDSSVKIVKSDSSLGTQNKAVGTRIPSAINTYLSYGSSSDLWGETWAYTDINDTDFGVVFSSYGTYDDESATHNVDHIRITVYYTETSTISPFPSFFNT